MTYENTQKNEFVQAALAVADTRHYNYSEAKALTALLRNITQAAADANDHFDETGDWIDPDIYITVAGQQTAFYLGGPQMQAICKFVENIAEENGYDVDFASDTVTEETEHAIIDLT